MRTKTSYSRFLQNVVPWEDFPKGRMIQSLHHSVEHDITSFVNSDFSGNRTVGKLFGVALSESGLSRDEIQLISKYGGQTDLVTAVEEQLIELETDYLDLLLLREEQLSRNNLGALEQLMSQGKLIDIGGIMVPEAVRLSFEVPLMATLFPSPLDVASSLQHLPPREEVPEEMNYFIAVSPDHPASLPDIFKELAPNYNCSDQQLYLAWLLQHPSHLHLEIDYTEKEELAAAMTVKEKRLDPIDWQKIRVALGPHHQ